MPLDVGKGNSRDFHYENVKPIWQTYQCHSSMWKPKYKRLPEEQGKNPVGQPSGKIISKGSKTNFISKHCKHLDVEVILAHVHPTNKTDGCNPVGYEYN